MSTDADNKPIFQSPPKEIFSVEPQSHFQRSLEQIPREPVFESSPEIEEPVFRSSFDSVPNSAEDAE